MKKFEFASPGYIEELKRQLDDAFKSVDLAGIEFIISEEYTDPPDHLCQPGRRSIGFHIQISKGEYKVGDRPRDDADVCIVADYKSVLPFIKRLHPKTAEEEAELQKARIQLAAEGKVQIKGDMNKQPSIMKEAELHDRMAVPTL